MSLIFGVFLHKNFVIRSNPRFSTPSQNTENRTKKAAILAHDRVQRGMGLAASVTSNQEHRSLHFAHFHLIWKVMVDIARDYAD